MLPKTTINRSWKVDVSDNRCSIDCEYCTDDAFYIDDLLLNSEESLRSFRTDPREAVVEGNHTELYVENVFERNPNKCDMKSSSPRKENNLSSKMSSSRRVSRSKQDDGEFLLECKAAFLSVYDDIGDRIGSKKDLLTVLQQSGRNPSSRALEKHWPRHTDELSFNDFVDICRKEPVTTSDDLMKAFRKIDLNGDGYISLDELCKIMNAKGETMSRDEVRRMIDEVDDNKDGRLDYREFCNMIMKTTNDCKKMSMKMMERKERKKKGKTRSDISGDKHEKDKHEKDKHEKDKHEKDKHEKDRHEKDRHEKDKHEKDRHETDKHEKEESSRHSNNHHQESHHHRSKVSEQPKAVKQKDSGAKSKDISPKTPRDAEQVEEDKQVNDDEDIVISSRPTPKIDLKASPGKDSVESKHKTEHKKVSEAKEDKKVSEADEDKKSSTKIHKGKTNGTDDDALHAHKNGDGMHSLSSEKSKTDKTATDTNVDKSVTEKTESMKIEKQEVTKSGITIIVTEDGDDKEDKDSKNKPKSTEKDGESEETGKTDDKSGKQKEDEVKSARVIDEIFKTTYVLPEPEKAEIKGSESEEALHKTEKKNEEPKTHTATLLDKIFKRFSPRSTKIDTEKTAEKQKDKSKKEVKDNDDQKTSSKTSPRSERHADYKTKDAEEEVAHKSESQENKQNKDQSARNVDEIFKTSAKLHKDVTQDMYVLGKDGEEKKHSSEKKNDATETKPPRPKEKVNKNVSPQSDSSHTKEETVTPRVGERGIKQQHEDTESKSSDKHKENGFGSQSSLRSGDTGAPVPSPRKAIGRVSEDDMPKPSPRVRPRDQKPKTSARGKLPDPRTLRDWSVQTSKGCFFYEDDEIVTHVYNLNIREESAVYFTAYPIQEPASLALPSHEPVDTALYILDSRGKLVTFTEQTDSKGRYGVKCDLGPGEYQIIPYTTGCRFKQRSSSGDHVREAKLVKKDRDDKLVITSAFRKALEDIFDLCDLDDNGTMSKSEFNWFNVRTSGEELGDDEWEVVEERTSLENGEITKAGFIALNEMEAEDSNGDVDDLWITLSSMGFNKALIMDEACPYRVEVYVERPGRREPKFKCTGIESLQKKELVQEICNSVIEKSQSEPVKIRNMKDLYMHTYKNDHRASIALENRSRSRVNVEVDCNKSKNAVSHRDSLDHTVEVEPQSMAIAHHLMPAREGADWTVICTETVHK